MSGSRFAPDEVTIIDLGTAPKIFIDGLAYYSERGGIVRAGYFATTPVSNAGDPCAGGRMQSILALEMVCSIEAHRQMMRQIARDVAAQAPALRLA